MKIAILTQPIYINYGGILQAYAVQKVLKDMGHDVVTLDIPWTSSTRLTLFSQLYLFFATIFYYALGRIKSKDIFLPFNTKKRNAELINNSMRSFICKYIDLSCPIYTEEQLKDYILKNNIDACIVGSDQVWRPRYSPNIGWFFLNFISNNDKIKKIALSASFGTEEWEYNEEQTKMAIESIKKFDAISVREASGVLLCKEKLGVDAIHIVDPTMMLSCCDYSLLIRSDILCDKIVRSHAIFAYILDLDNTKREIIDKYSQQLHRPVSRITTEVKLSPYTSKSKAKKLYPPSVSCWLNNFEKSDFVITDSFHGTVFSILYHRPFVVVRNQHRGLVRIESLLDTFGLQHRLISSSDVFSDDWLMNGINWNKVDKILSTCRAKFQSFLKNNLS